MRLHLGRRCSRVADRDEAFVKAAMVERDYKELASWRKGPFALDAVDYRPPLNVIPSIDLSTIPACHGLGCGLIKPEPETDASDFDHCKIVESAAVVSGRDVAELLELVEAALDEIAVLVFGFAIGDAVVTV